MQLRYSDMATALMTCGNPVVAAACPSRSCTRSFLVAQHQRLNCHLTLSFPIDDHSTKIEWKRKYMLISLQIYFPKIAQNCETQRIIALKNEIWPTHSQQNCCKNHFFLDNDWQLCLQQNSPLTHHKGSPVYRFCSILAHSLNCHCPSLQ